MLPTQSELTRDGLQGGDDRYILLVLAAFAKMGFRGNEHARF
jgi:hypothetical protein